MFSYHLSLKNMIFFLLQLLGGFVSFLFPKLPDAMRAEYLKIHVFFGVFIFALAVGTCLMGIVEKLFFSKYVTTSVCLAFILRPYLTGPVIWLMYQSNQSFNVPGHLMGLFLPWGGWDLIILVFLGAGHLISTPRPPRASWHEGPLVLSIKPCLHAQLQMHKRSY